MDSVYSILSRRTQGKRVNIIKLDENVWINKINTFMNLNELTKVNNFNSMCESVAEFTDINVSNLFRDVLEKENKELKNINIKIEEKETYINRLESKLKDIKLSLSLQSNKILLEAKQLVNEEIKNNEKELQTLYKSKVNLLKTVDESSFLDKGYIDVILTKQVESYKLGTLLMAKAEDMTSLGDSDMVEIIDPNTQKKFHIEKKYLKLK
jgi:hypothetical protein